MRANLLIDRDIETDVNESVIFSQSLTLKSFTMKSRIFVFLMVAACMGSLSLSCPAQCSRPDKVVPDPTAPVMEVFNLKIQGLECSMVSEVVTENNIQYRCTYIVSNQHILSYETDNRVYCSRADLQMLELYRLPKTCQAKSALGTPCMRVIEESETYCPLHKPKSAPTVN